MIARGSGVLSSEAVLRGCGLPGGEARILLAHVLDTAPVGLLTRDVDGPQQARFAELVERRRGGEPLQHLTGVAWFRHVAVQVGPGVFVPRPETELLAGWAIDVLAALPGSPVVVELCAGSGVISKAIADERPGCRQYAVEVSDEAVAYAQRNLAGTGVELIHADMADALSELDTTVDVVVANPPYIPWEAWESVTAEVRDHDPAIALFSGDDGLDAMRVVAAVAARLLRPGGVAGAEHAEVQHASAPRVWVEQRAGGSPAFAQVRDHRDLNDRPRFVTAVRRGGREDYRTALAG